MGTYAAIDHTTWIDGHDFTGDTNQTSLVLSGAAQENTVFSNTARTRVGGLLDVESQINGFWDDPVDDAAHDNLGTTDLVATQSVDGTEASVAYMYQLRKFSYQTFGTIGEVMPFVVNIMGTKQNGAVGAVRGQVAATKQNVSATGALGSAVNLGAVAADEFLYATIHVFTAGTTITIDVESDDAQAFSTPTSQATIGPLTTTGGTWMTRVAGATSDTWYRFNVTAVTGTFSVAGAIGIK